MKISFINIFNLVVYGEYLNSFSIECYLSRSCSSSTFYLNYTESINIIADSKRNWTLSIWSFEYNKVYAQNSGDIYLYCSFYGCFRSNPLIDASNANSLNLTCNGSAACIGNTIYCPNNGPRGGYTANINIENIDSWTFYENIIYAVEQFGDVIFNCKQGCNNVTDVGLLKCNPQYTSECTLVSNGNSIECVNSVSECSHYLLPTVTPTSLTISPTNTPSIQPTSVTTSPTLLTYSPSMRPTTFPTLIPTPPTASPTNAPTTQTYTPTKTPTYIPTKMPTYVVNTKNIKHIYSITSKNLPWIVILGITLLLVSNMICIGCCIYIYWKMKTIKTETEHANNIPIAPKLDASNMDIYQTPKSTNNNEGKILNDTELF